MKSERQVIVRFAPSPTGDFHIGSARTALFNYLFAKNQKGKIILRLDDTDQDRSKPEYEQNIKDSLDWLGLLFDEEYHQLKRSEIYRLYLESLIKSGQAYVSKEKPTQIGDREEVIRFKNPNKEIVFTDLIRGLIKFNTEELGDFVIAKDLNTPLYHFASVVDDKEMNISHIIRGEDHISNTPRQILMTEALAAPKPIYAHIPLILAPDKTKLSKRHGALAVTDYRDQGYLPEAIINWLAFLGWSPQSVGINDKEIFSLEELIEIFSIKKIQKGAAVFNVDKLNWFNHEYLKRLSDEDWLAEIEKYLPNETKKLPLYSREKLNKIIPIFKERITTLKEIENMAQNNELDYFFDAPKINSVMIKNTQYLGAVGKLIAGIPEDNFTPESIKNAVWDFATEKGRQEVLWPLRVALTGQEKSPDPFTVASIIGKPETLKRIAIATTL